MLREKSGLSLNLSEGEMFSLERKTVDENQKNPEELFKLAAHSFFESDGHAALFYFEKSLESDTLSPILRKFAQLSLNRLKYPEIYEESIGVIVMKLIPHSNFSIAGLLEGDVIVSLNSQVIYEPMDIASGLATHNPVLVRVIRDNKFLDIVVKGGESAGAALSQLIILRVFQL
ncbi:MAG: PDZ domain-containing protein [Richelia sp. RM1_1_1]|nr:PDZ domain-containing protein [Richelia sp. RM1_1_1]